MESSLLVTVPSCKEPIGQPAFEMGCLLGLSVLSQGGGLVGVGPFHCLNLFAKKWPLEEKQKKKTWGSKVSLKSGNKDRIVPHGE